MIPTILMIESDAERARQLREHLAAGADSRWNVIWRQQLDEALRVLDESKPSAVLLSPSLPGASGLAALRMIRSHKPSVPVVVLCEGQDRGFGLNALKQGAQDYLLQSEIDAGLLERILEAAIARGPRQRKPCPPGTLCRHLIEMIPLPALIYRPKTLEILEANEAAARRYGHRRVELLGMLIGDLWSGDKPAEFINPPPSRSMSSGITSVFSHRSKDGRTFKAEISACRCKLDGKPAILMISRDISRRLRIQEALLESDLAYHTTFSKAPVGLAHIGLDGSYLRVNDELCRLLGYEEEELLGKRYQDVTLPESVAADEEGRLGILSGRRQTHVAEKAYKRKDGSAAWCQVTVTLLRGPSGEPAHFITAAQDITSRRQAENEMTLLAHALRSVSEGVAIFDMEGNVVLVNAAFRGMFGYDDTDILGRSGCMFCPEGSAPGVFKDVMAATAAGGWHGEMLARRKDGNLFPLSLSTSVIRDESGHAIAMVGISNDITERRRAEQEIELLHRIALAAGEANDFASALQAVISAVCQAARWEIGQAWIPSDDGNHLVCGPAWYSSAPGMGPFRQRSIAQLLKRGQGMPGKAWQTQRPVWVDDLSTDPEAPRRHAARAAGIHGGVAVPIVSSGGVIAILEFFVLVPRAEDQRFIQLAATIAAQLGLVIERRRAEDKLHESEERSRMLVENANDIIFTSDPAGNLKSINQPGVKSLGYSLEELLRMNIAGLVTPEHQEMLQQILGSETASDSPTIYELDFVAKDGRRLSLEISSQSMYEDGKPVAIQSIARDKTERKLLEDQLRHAQRMESVGTLAGGIAHDFNNILTGILGFAEFGASELPPGDPHREEFEQIKRLGERAAALTKQLLAFARKQVIEGEAVDINHCISNSFEFLGRVIGEQIELELKLEPHLRLVRADAGQIEQVVMNLCVNARDAIEGPGQIVIQSQNVSIGQEYCDDHPGAAPGDYVLIGIRDNGAGIDRETQKRIFEPFFTTKPVGRGTGLGLAVVYGIVKQHEGFMEVISEKGRGSEFRIYLPVLVGESVKPTKEVREIQQGGDETILVVEDDVSVRDVVVMMLKPLGYQVHTASDGKEALSLIDAGGCRFDLIISDTIMPRMSGVDLFRTLRNRGCNVKFLLTTGYDFNVLNKSLMIETNLPLLMKPFKPLELAKTVRALLDSPASDCGMEDCLRVAPGERCEITSSPCM